MPETVQALLVKAGYDVVLPASLEKLCCGMPFNSKGFLDVAQDKLDELGQALKSVSRDGRDPIVFDTSPCAMRAKQVAVGAGLKVYDMIEALDALVLDRVDVTPSNETIAVHTTCSARRMGLEPVMQRVAGPPGKCRGCSPRHPVLRFCRRQGLQCARAQCQCFTASGGIAP